MTLREYVDSIRNKRVAVIGIGVSNTPLLDMLLAEGIHVTVCDKRTREQMGRQAEDLERRGCALHLGEDYLQGLDADVIFRTPGLRPDVPEIAACVSRGAETTTTTIIAELLKAAGKRVWVGGNIGHPLLCEADGMLETDYAVLELSSFQLMTMTRSPHIAVVTNLAPNHLDMHRDMAEYVAAKENIFCHQGWEDIAVFNADNAITAELSTRAPGRARTFSRQGEVADGVFLRGEDIVCRSGRHERTIMTTGDIKIPGVHNVENYMAAIAAVDGLVDDATIRTFAREFGGVEHRIELVRTYRGVRYYNDSIASSPSRTIAGLRSFNEKVILIAGGYDKHIPFDALGPEAVAHVKLLVLCGATADKIRAAVENAPGYAPGCPEIIDVTPFTAAVEAARDRAQPGDVVTLSPACAAFDQFRNFAERGKFFKSIVNSWQE